MTITRNNAPSVVMISLEDYEALQETAYLLRTPKNARRLLESVIELEQDIDQQNKLLENGSAGASPGADIVHGKTN